MPVEFILLMTPYVALVGCVAAVVALVVALQAKSRLTSLTVGTSKSLEETINELLQHKKDSEAFRKDMERYLKLVETRLRSSVAGIGLVRFNPFENSSGSNQSFAVAFLDEQHNGIVLSSLYARDRMAIYGKPLEKGVSTFALTEEEKEAILQATTQISGLTGRTAK